MSTLSRNDGSNEEKLSYESPCLRKHGKVNTVTQLIPIPGPFDNAIGPFEMS